MPRGVHPPRSRVSTWMYTVHGTWGGPCAYQLHRRRVGLPAMHHARLPVAGALLTMPRHSPW